MISFIKETATTEIFTLSLHDALPILRQAHAEPLFRSCDRLMLNRSSDPVQQECRDRKSGSAGMPRPISYAVFCLKKKNAKRTTILIKVPAKERHHVLHLIGPERNIRV